MKTQLIKNLRGQARFSC